MAIDGTHYDHTPYSPTEMDNQGFDRTYQVPTIEPLGFDGTYLQRTIADSLAIKITTSGSIKYVGIAAPGTAQSSAKWQARKIDKTDPNNITITWADSAKFSQTATDLTALTYA